MWRTSAPRSVRRGRGTAGPGMPPTDTADPAYFHKVVDCQWACPAHTPVPEYIRLIAAGRYADAYMVNWHSNVFPGVLGRTCDRPCEPACRRGRVEAEPVAICRLKRVAADNKGDIRARLPQARGGQERQARRARRRRPGLAHGRARSVAARLRGGPLRQGPAGGRDDAHADPQVPAAGKRARRGGRLRPRPHAGAAARPDDREPEGAARGRVRCRLRWQRRAARARSCSPRAGRRPRPASTSASTGWRA